MSILSEYEVIRKRLGEKTYRKIVKFLKAHPDLLLSDVYYKEEVWKNFEVWKKKREITETTILLPEKYWKES